MSRLTPYLRERLITERAPIHTYRKAIRTAKPYISFVYIDTDTLPAVTNIPLIRRSLYARFIDDTTRQPELHVLYRGGSRQGYDGQTPKIQAFTLDNQASSVEVTFPIGEQHVFLDATLNPKDQREIPIVQSLTLGAPVTAVEATFPIRDQHVFLDATLNPKDQREIPVVQSLALGAPVTAVEATFPIGEQHVFLDATLNPKDQREIPVVQSLTLNAQAGAVANTISCATLRPSLDVSFNPFDQREKLVVQSLKQDVRTGSEEKTISIIQQKASLDFVFNLDKRHEEISTIAYALDHKPAQYTNKTTREERQIDNYNHSLVIIEPRCSDYPVSKTRNRSRIVRYDRYSRANHIVSKQDKA